MSRIWVLLIIIFSGCIHRQIEYKEIHVTAKLSRKYFLKSKSAEIIKLDSLGENILYEIKFKKVTGGDEKIFGFTLKEGNGYKTKRLSVYKNDKMYKSLSIIELTNDFQYVNDINMNDIIKQ